ncbi:MAG: methylenetetrahydrofolate reductase [Deltaproteobacteria bacterium]|nr:methylenetetrahydrofolate reductase [Deltaproteobacteria bacterium]MBW2076405.1 methylenetetrahydrofolate reductase [Deltaproteobacteria bacterium]MBW2310655.1 methylenetetrahydrofolate reductase [Deltaproteobacteria bacterium]RLB28136.1 MAG: methylenetetrahydrofolate reductase [Deltaproteobacteria bacterium]
MKSGSNLERLLERGEFVVTGELGPPKGPDANVVKEKAAMLKDHVDAVNITDNQSATVRMSSIAACKILIDEGLEPTMQMVARDRNRIAMMADLFGATALGIKNMLCLSGDHQIFGNHPEAKNVFDIDSIQMIHMVKTMRDEHKVICEDEIEGEFTMYIGAACNPFADPAWYRPHRLAKKVEAGVDFIQTQCIYDMNRFRAFMKQVVDMGLHEKCKILAGVTPLKSIGMARYMAANVSGIIIPDDMINRLRDAGKGNVAAEGIKILCEQMQELKDIEGVAGIHLMAIEWEHRVPEIMKMAGFLPRPTV